MAINNLKSIFQRLFLSAIFAVIFSLSLVSTVSAATLFISPASSSITVGNIVSVNVIVATNNEAINSSDGTINFPTDLLEVVSINKASSIFSFWVEDPAFNNSEGVITFDGGLPSPGYTGNKGQVFSIVFRTKKSGTASIVFSGSAVRKNDGLGTDALTGTGAGTINIAPNNNQEVAPAPIPVNAPSAPVVTSSTHPEQNKWYNNQSVNLEWVVPKDVTGVQTLIGNNPSSLPTVTYNTPLSSKKIPKLEDGTWYFHIRFKNASGWGKVASFKIQIDTVAPNPFKITFPDGEMSDSQKPAVYFAAKDDLSGIDHYEVKVDGGSFVNIQEQGSSATNLYHIEPQEPGVHNLLVKAVDFAGNETVQTSEFTVKSIDVPVIKNYQSELSENALLSISGTATPTNSVEIVIKNSKGEEKSKIALTLSNGNFSLVWPDKFEVGSYTFTARSVDASGAKSIFTSPTNFTVKPSLLSVASTFIVNWLPIIIMILIALGGILLLIVYFHHRAVLMRKNMDKKVRATESSIHKTFDQLREEVRDLQDKIDKSEMSLEKEIEDIEKK